MELSSKVCDLCQICNWARTVTREMLDQLCKAVWHTKLDIVGAFNCIRMKEGEE